MELDYEVPEKLQGKDAEIEQLKKELEELKLAHEHLELNTQEYNTEKVNKAQVPLEELVYDLNITDLKDQISEYKTEEAGNSVQIKEDVGKLQA